MNKCAYLTVFASIMVLTACGGDADSVKVSAPKPKTQAVQTVAAKTSEPALTAAEAQLEKGRVLFKRCKSCHTLNQGGRNRVGPNLWDIAGNRAGHRDDFNYSNAMKNAGIVWTDENLEAYIANPRVFMPKNRMSFAGLRKPEDQKAVIAYVKSQTTPASE